MLQTNSQVTPYKPPEIDESRPVADVALDVVRSTAGLLQRQWILILGTTAVFLSIAIIYLIVAPPVFSARAIMIIDAKKEPSFQQQSAQYKKAKSY
jgi:LPS O-antigen subunit length determinant protein (WzzB/FepE family)